MAVILTAAVITRLQPLTRGLGQDELYTAVHFIEAGSIRNAIFSNAAFNNHIGYSVMAQVSENLFGHSEWSLRLPALVLGLGSLYLFWIFSEPMLAFYGAMIGTIMLALSPPHVVWSVELAAIPPWSFSQFCPAIFISDFCVGLRGLWRCATSLPVSAEFMCISIRVLS